MLKPVALALVGGVLGGCATVPDVSLTYYLATWKSVISVTQTLGCDASRTRLLVLNTPALATTYSRDLGSPASITTRSINIKELSGAFADSEIGMTFTDDGRLKGINQSSTGEGEAIVKSAITLVGAVAGVAALSRRDGTLSTNRGGGGRSACAEIERWGRGKPVTLNYQAAIKPSNIGQAVPLSAGPESKALYEILKPALPALHATVGSVSEIRSGAKYRTAVGAEFESVVLLELQEIGTVLVTTYADADPIGTARIVVPLPTTYPLPIPKPALFGKQTFSIGLSEAGAITSIAYGKLAGTAGALNALGAIANAETTTEKAQAEALKAHADLIVQQQRVLLCESKPDECK